MFGTFPICLVMFCIKAALRAVFLWAVCALLAACTDEAISRYELQNTSYRGTDPVSGGLLKLKFYRNAVDVRYGRRNYPKISEYDYNAEHLQGSILIRNFAFAGGTRADVVWLFRVAKDTNSLTLQIFDDQSKPPYEALLLKE